MFDVTSESKDKKESGVWLEYMGGEFLIASGSKMAFQRTLSRLQQPHQKKIDKGILDPEISQQILCKSLARHILLDWKNVGAKGKELEYSEENAAKVLASNVDLRSWVSDASLDMDNFREEALEEEGKPSQTD